MEHIEKSLADNAARTACFIREGENASQILESAVATIRYNRDFVDNTKKIVTRLKAVSHTNTSSGTVLFCKYKAANYSGQSFLAILKLDPTIGFQKKEIKDKGKTFIQLNKVEDLIPSAKVRLLKCAFIRYRKVKKAADFKDFDMVVLDRQQPNEPAEYFSTKFLGARWFKESKVLTREFIYGATDALDQVREDIGRSKSEVVRQAIELAVKGTNVRVKPWIENLNISDAAKEVFEEKIEKRVPDASFVPDPEVAKMTDRRVFKGDFGFRMVVNTVGYKSIVKKRTLRNGREYFELSVPNFKEVLK